MHLHIDPSSSIPLYQQLVDTMKEAVARGFYSPGEKIPTVRELAAELTINPNTVAKAYQKLEQEGIITTMRSRGTFIASRAKVYSQEEVSRMLKPALDRLRVDAYHLGLSPRELRKLVLETIEEWEKERQDT
ncbi:MAG: GntR family transcriptional regulator [Syntrophomonadaceae bacterium]